MQNNRPTTETNDPYSGYGRHRVAIILTVAAAIVLAGALHLVGVLPPG